MSKELEGDWEGSLETPNRSVGVVVHFRNQPGRTVAATIDTGGDMDSERKKPRADAAKEVMRHRQAIRAALDPLDAAVIGIDAGIQDPKPDLGWS